MVLKPSSNRWATSGLTPLRLGPPVAVRQRASEADIRISKLFCRRRKLFCSFRGQSAFLIGAPGNQQSDRNQ